MEISLAPIPIVFAKIRGKKGVRELKAIISPASEYTVITNKDALQTGYDFSVGRDGGGALVITAGGIMKAAIVKIEEISVGECSAKGVEALCYELPEPAGADLILGRTFLKNFSLLFDYSRDVLRMLPLQQSVEVAGADKTRS